jgi:putative toxin-antitoxin system antitoxin component (TIGR02293 family)
LPDEPEESMTPLELAKKAAAETITWAHDRLALGYTDLGRALDANERTVRRWQGREVAPRGAHRERLERLGELRHLLREVFESGQEADEWLHSPVRTFRGRTPISMIRQGNLNAVVEALATIESGAYL